MKKTILLTIVLVLLLAGCGKQEAYVLHYESPYLKIIHSNTGEEALREENMPMVSIESQEDYDAFCKALEESFSHEATVAFQTYFKETVQNLYAENLFADWTVVVIYRCEPENVAHIMEERSVQDGILKLRYSKVVTGNEGTKQVGWLIPIWITKPQFEDVAALEAQLVDTYDQRYPLKVTQGAENEQHTLLETASIRDIAVKTYGLSEVEIDFAGEKKLLQTALEDGTITAQQLVMRARIDAAGGLCDIQQYNDGGTVVYVYEDYRLYKIKQFTASGTVEGDVWITSLDVELNQLK